ncbi:VWA domain-containing protein [Cytophagaceae bacterium YF14B1]|uniref:VWA domain-containing protein n=1 Tax=Xanthocytophaga flava TaxID=3048013 RepID=A0AAE3U7Z6_9BACT|nr:VWA domain-containing protein [Xanthocytophaga flavus]MDJ1483464.1 VWA domain-containing protein [Xanthocytophaga flavus]
MVHLDQVLSRLFYKFRLPVALLCLVGAGFIASSFYQKSIPSPKKPESMAVDNVLQWKVVADNLYYVKERKELYLYVDLKASKAQKKSDRTPLNLSLVLDRSGSMNGDKIKYAREACKFVVDNLEPSDNLSIVVYDDQVDVLTASAPVKDKATLKKLIDNVHDRGSTNLSGGMLEGYAQVHKTQQRNYVNRVLLLSDGLANQGITDEKVLQQLARQKNNEDNMTLSAFGVGADFNELLMTNLAEYGSGNYYFIDSPDKIPSIFAKELHGLLSVVAQNTLLRIKFPSQNLSVNKMFGYQGQVKGDELVFDLKDVFSEEQKAILIKFTVTEPLTEDAIFTSTLTYDDAVTFQRVNASENTRLKVTTDKALFDRSFDKDVLQNIVLFETNERLENAMLEVDHGNFEGAKKMIITLKSEMEVQMKNLPENADLSRQYNTVMEYEKQVENAKTMSSEELKYNQKASRSSNYQIRKKK